MFTLKVEDEGSRQICPCNSSILLFWNKSQSWLSQMKPFQSFAFLFKPFRWGTELDSISLAFERSLMSSGETAALSIAGRFDEIHRFFSRQHSCILEPPLTQSSLPPRIMTTPSRHPATYYSEEPVQRSSNTGLMQSRSLRKTSRPNRGRDAGTPRVMVTALAHGEPKVYLPKRAPGYVFESIKVPSMIWLAFPCLHLGQVHLLVHVLECGTFSDLPRVSTSFTLQECQRVWLIRKDKCDD